MFFADNTFHLPPGPVEHSIAWMNSIHPMNSSTITSISLDLSSKDMTPIELEKASYCAIKLSEHPAYGKALGLQEWNAFIELHLTALWERKISFLEQWGQVSQISLPGGLVVTVPEPKDEQETTRGDDGIFSLQEDDYIPCRRVGRSYVRNELEQPQLPYIWKRDPWAGPNEKRTLRIVAKRR